MASAHGVELSSRSASARVSGVASALAIRSFVLSSVSSFEGGSRPDVPKIETLRPVPPRCIVLAVDARLPSDGTPELCRLTVCPPVAARTPGAGPRTSFRCRG